MLVRRALVHREQLSGRDLDAWPFNVPCVAELLASGLEFDRPVTFLVGENGSGKSTLVEALAEAFGLDARGGRAGRKYVNDRPKTPLGDVLTLDLTRAGSQMRSGPRRRQKGYFLRAETASRSATTACARRLGRTSRWSSTGRAISTTRGATSDISPTPDRRNGKVGYAGNALDTAWQILFYA